MTIQRMEHMGIVVDDLEAATAFFVELGLKLVGPFWGQPRRVRECC
jgi:catechol 2,3-dioxygenase-like lactoylglutathione lyase family enzyme